MSQMLERDVLFHSMQRNKKCVLKQNKKCIVLTRLLIKYPIPYINKMTIQNLYFLWLWYISYLYALKNIEENNAWERNNRNCYMSTNWVWDDQFLSCQSFFSFLLQLFDFIQQFWSKTKRTIRSHHHSVLLAVRKHSALKIQ